MEKRSATIKNPEEPKITSATIPEHLLGTKKCTGVGKIGNASLINFTPQFRIAKVNVDCNDCHTTIQTTVKY